MAAAPAFSHGVGYRRSQKQPVALEFYYSTGEVMAYTEVKVYSPDDRVSSYQSGLTDEFGRYSFVPGTEGEWRMVVSDTEGHRAEAVIPVSEAKSPDGAQVTLESSFPRGSELYIRALLGTSVLFNVASFVTVLRRKAAEKCT
jgi:nickel transport protein